MRRPSSTPKLEFLHNRFAASLRLWPILSDYFRSESYTIKTFPPPSTVAVCHLGLLILLRIGQGVHLIGSSTFRRHTGRLAFERFANDLPVLIPPVRKFIRRNSRSTRGIQLAFEEFCKVIQWLLYSTYFTLVTSYLSKLKKLDKGKRVKISMKVITWECANAAVDSWWETVFITWTDNF